MQKTLSLLVAFFAAVLLLREKQKPFVSTKEPFFFLQCFLQMLFLKNEEKTSLKKYRAMFSYPFVAHMPKIRQI